MPSNPIKRYDTTHGKRQTPEYYLWNMMCQRCNNPNNQDYHRYGARGITVCDKWRNSFAAFFADMGKRPTPQHTLDRQDNNQGYTPENTIWATRDAQARNRRSTIMITYEGITMCAQDWAVKLGIKPHTFLKRLREGWPIEDAMTIPVRSSMGPKGHPKYRTK